MSKKVRNLIIGLVILVVLGGVLALLMLTQGDGQGDDVSSEPPYAVDSIKLVDKKPENITSIQVKNKEDSYTISRDKDKQFTIDKLNGFDQTSETMDVTAVRAAAMSATKEVETTLDNQKKYGLDAPQAEVTVTFDDKSEFTFYLGNQAPSDKGYYLKVKGKESVYIATENMAGNFLQPSRYYVDLTINHVEDTSKTPTINEMSVSRSDLAKPITITKGDPVSEDDPLASMKSEYRLTSPFNADLSKEEGEAVVSTFFTLTADEVIALNPNSAQLKEYGFDKPTMTVTVKSSDNKTHKLTVGKGIYCDEDPSEVESGHTHTIEYYYVMYDSKNVVYKITASTLSWLTLDVQSIISKYVLTPMITDVERIDVTVDGKKYTMDLTHKTVKATQSGESDKEELASAMVNGKSVSTTNFKDFYQFLIQVTVDSLVTDKPTESPRMTITYHYKAAANKDDDVLQFVPYGERRVAVVVNGEANFVTRSAYVDRAVENLAAIAEGKTINPNW